MGPGGVNAVAARSRWRRLGWCIAGFAALGLGLAGAALPLLPTTPFLLLALACFLRGSPAMHRWMLENRLFGGQLRAYREGRRISAGARAFVLAVLWAGLAVSAALVRSWAAWALLLAVGAGVTWHVVLVGRPRRPLPEGETLPADPVREPVRGECLEE